MSRLQSVPLPSFGRPESLPEIPIAEYQRRLAAVVERMEREGLDVLVVYGDREHFANLAYLLGIEPRFEEMLLLLDRRGGRTLVVGNECMGYLPDEALGCRTVLWGHLSLMGQPRDPKLALRTILADFGIGKGTIVGTAGWKHFEPGSFRDAATMLDLPSYMADTLRKLTGSASPVRNANAIFMGKQDGLRIVNGPEQIAQFEFASTRTSDSTLAALRAVRPGAVESELEALLIADGLPLSCHRMVNFGDKVKRGLSSPACRKAALGDAFVVGYGLWGALTCRAGAVAAGPADLPAPLKGFYERLVANYFDVVATWYERIRIGVTGGEVFDAVEAVRDAALYQFAVNPGHYLHLDEWVHSPFASGDGTELRSGMALQADIIPVSQGPFCYSNAEDGVVLADADLRSRLARQFPDCWKRIEARRDFMRDAIGIALDDSVLPLSNFPAWLPPYAMDLGKAMVRG